MTGGKREIIDQDPVTGTRRTTYSYPSEPPSIAVPLAIQELTDSEPTDLEPMHYAADIDPDALNDLFRPSSGTASRDATVTFTYHGYAVTVKGYGRIVIRSPDAHESRSAR